MQLQIIEGYITGYATIGGIIDGVEVPDNVLESCDRAALIRHCYRWEWETDITQGVAVLDEDKLAAIIAAEQLDEIRARREAECFPVINRGQAWYALLTPEQSDELMTWYQSWLDAPQTGIVPDPPDWLK